MMNEDDSDPFSFITTMSHVSTSQQSLLRRVSSTRLHERFPTFHSPPPDSQIPAESSCIRVESPPEEEFLTPEEDSLPAVSSGETTVVIEWGGNGAGGEAGEFKVVGRKAAEKRKGLEVVDLGGTVRQRESKRGLDEDYRRRVVGLGADQVFEEMSMRRREVKRGERENTSVVAVDLVPVRKRDLKKGLDEDMGTQVADLDEEEICRNREADRGLDENVSPKIVDLGGDQEFNEMPMRKRDEKMGERENTIVEAVDLDKDRDLRVRKRELEKGFDEDMGTQVVHLDEDEMCRNEEVEMGLDENVSTEVVDLGADQEFDKMHMRNREVKMGERENTSIEAVDMDEDSDLLVGKGQLKKGFDEDMGTQVVDLGEDEMLRNKEVERGLFENISTEIVDLEENGTCGDLGMRDGEMEMDHEENSRADVDCDEDELYGDLTNRNLVGEIGTSKGGEVRREIRVFAEKGIEEIDHSKCVVPKNEENRQKDIGNSGWRELYDDLSQRGQVIEKAVNKASEPCRDENRGSSDKGIEEIDRLIHFGPENDEFHQKGICDNLHRKNPNAKTVFNAGNEPCSDRIRGFAEKEADLPSSDDICQKDKGLAEVRKLPSSLRRLAEIACSESDASHRERNREENRHKRSNKSKCVGRKSRDSDELRELPSTISGQTKNDKIMKNILDALELITRGEKEKGDDGSDEEVDFLETAMIMGMVFPRPRWWPEEGFDDD